ncbi:Ribosomal RNA-processing protein 9 [Wickerhamiella sorbophila]|uniref:Ribosomal RNA-processing protein 9 n=1 Tax=Wickerhamiella sorbophila TaxID=45607 RepID=A0A2T0FNC5_9ASCO|nr:Ribosomal RNA-processing protein 9 [Wickerhamiella sorbophila]PRT56477.1 Ribosomal RNA-processing protein 9 [Wickerhamiella sorbophila]
MVDSFFVNPAKRAKKRRSTRESSLAPTKKASRSAEADEEITSDSDLSEISQDEDESFSSESDHETAADKRRKLAKEYLDNLQTELQDEHAFDAQDLDREIISRRLKQDVAENQGRLFRFLDNSAVSRAFKSRTKAKYLTSVAACWPYAFSVSKSAELQRWRLSLDQPPVLEDTVKASNHKKKGNEKYLGHTGEILCIAVSPNGHHVVTGGRDHRIVVWSSRTLMPIKVFDTRDRHGTVLNMVFRRGSTQLYVACADLRVRTYDLEQMAQVEILYGHQDEVVDIAALAEERCISVGSRDRSAIVWKIPEESRLTFRGGDQSRARELDVLEGSIDVCSMLDNQLFVTGSDNGNISLWSLAKKKPLHIYRHGHGHDPQLTAAQASGEANASDVEIPPANPRYITALAAIPYSNVFFTGSWDGTVKMWKLSEDQRHIEFVREIAVGAGVVVRLSVAEQDAKPNRFVLVAALSREHRLGRWLTRPGHDAVVSFSV